jgi:hypothetical protein
MSLLIRPCVVGLVPVQYLFKAPAELSQLGERAQVFEEGRREEDAFV